MGEADFHVYCQKGNLTRVKQIVQSVSKQKLNDILTSKRGVFGYTPLHDAAVNGNTEILNYLLDVTNNTHVNLKANGGYTPLHVAISSGKKESVEVLLNHSAELNVTDEFGKTPKQVAELNNQIRIALILIQQELFREVESNGQRVALLLDKYKDQLDITCLNKCLMAATLNDNADCISILVEKGATDLDACLNQAQRERKVHSCAILLLIKAATSGKKDILTKLFNDPGDHEETDILDQLRVVDILPDIQAVLKSGAILTTTPIKIALKQGHHHVREQLLMRTNVKKKNCLVNWCSLQLQQLQPKWLQEISWVQTLLLARNGFDSIPHNINLYLTQLVTLDLKYNKLTTIPKSLFMLPLLEELLLSNNSIKKFPDISRMPENLALLDISHNKLTVLPDHLKAPNMRHLNISSNSFSKVPPCIASFVALTDLNLSNNYSILELPIQMGRLSKLEGLDLTNLNDLRDPPREMRRNAQDCVTYLYNKLHNAKACYNMKILVVGSSKGGKTALVHTLVSKSKDIGKPYSDSGLEISKWSYRPGLTRTVYYFDIWDFGGPDSTMVQYCFYSQQALYLLLFDITKETNTIGELKTTLGKIVQRAPSSMVMLVGTHLDMVTTQNRAKADSLLTQVRLLARSYTQQLQIVDEVILVALRNSTKNISQLKNAIYNNATKYKTELGREIMGFKFPSTYHDLDKQLRLQQEVMHCVVPVPIMHLEDLKTTIKHMKFDSIVEDDPELQALTAFLTNRSSVFSYNNMTCGLHELIFTDPEWLYNIAAKISSRGGTNPLASHGLLHLKNVPHLFSDIAQLKYIDQLLILFDELEVALLMNHHCLLVPSLIPLEPPLKVSKAFKDNKPTYCRYIKYNPRNQAHSLSWSRLLSMIIHSIPCLQTAYAKIATSTVTDSMLEVSLSIPGNPNQAQRDITSSSIKSLDMSSHSLDMAPSSFKKVARGHSVAASHRIRPWSFHSVNDSLPSLSPVRARAIPAKIEKNSIHQFLSKSLFMSDMEQNSSTERSPNNFSTDESELIYWKNGLYFKNSLFTLKIENLTGYSNISKEGSDKLLIMATSNISGRQTVSQLVDLVHTYIDQWCPGPVGSQDITEYLEQSAPCLKCTKPYEFHFNDCLSLVAQNKSTVICGKGRDKNHSIDLADLFPELLFQDMKSNILLSSNDLLYEEMGSPTIRNSGYKLGTVHKRAAFFKDYKKYTNKEAFRRLHQEAVMLQQLQHPCVANLVGVSLYPTMSIAIESSPLGFLDQTLLKTTTPIHRIVIFRIAAEVAAALSFMHSQGVVYQNLNAASVMLWSLDPKSLCHCKLHNFENALHRCYVGVRGTQGPGGFTAPEILHLRQGSRQRSVYNHKTDVFSFGMFLYQLVARENPFLNIPISKVDNFIKMGRRPSLNDVTLARIGYHYLNMLMKKCWHQHPNRRPETNDLVKTLCTASVQSVMNVSPVEGRLPLINAAIVTSSDINKVGAPSVSHNEIWTYCNGNDQAEISVYNGHTMTLQHKEFIHMKSVQCMALCQEYMWVSVGVPERPSVLHIYTLACCDLVRTVDCFDSVICCMTTGGDHIFLGTSEGYCYSIAKTDIERVFENIELPHIHVSDHAIKGIAWSNCLIWVSHVHVISLINPISLEPLTTIGYGEEQNKMVGHLTVAMAGELVWSANLGEGTHFSAWDARNHKIVLDVDITTALSSIAGNTGNEQSITAITPVLDTVWVGTSTGHILIYRQDKLLMWHQPYAAAVRFLTVINSRGPCETERCMVISGGNEYFHSLPTELQVSDEHELQDGLDYLVVWEAHNATTIQQMEMVQKNSPRHLDNYGMLRQMIFNGEFEDGTHISTTRKLFEQ